MAVANASGGNPMTLYFLLLDHGGRTPDNSYPICGTYRAEVDDPTVLRSAPAHVSVDADDWRRAREPGRWWFNATRGVFPDDR
jgi:hypothetical protein